MEGNRQARTGSGRWFAPTARWRFAVVPIFYDSYGCKILRLLFDCGASSDKQAAPSSVKKQIEAKMMIPNHNDARL